MNLPKSKKNKVNYREAYLAGIEMWNSLAGFKLPRTVPRRRKCFCKKTYRFIEDKEGNICYGCGYITDNELTKPF